MSERAAAWLADRERGWSLQQIAEREGITRQRVAQILDAAYGHTGPNVHDIEPVWLAEALTLASEGVSHGEILRRLGVSRDALRRWSVPSQAGAHRPPTHTRESLLARLHAFHAEHGRTPTAAEWSPTLVRAAGGDPVWPALRVVQHHFGSWRAFLLAGGYPALRPGHRASDPNPQYDYPHEQEKP